jgi:hypothetical protein
VPIGLERPRKHHRLQAWLLFDRLATHGSARAVLDTCEEAIEERELGGTTRLILSRPGIRRRLKFGDDRTDRVW